MIDPQRIWSSSQLPTLPSVAVRLLELSKNPETQVRDVVEAIKTDPAITAKILKASNSSFFALSHKVTTLDRAVPLLGTTVVTSLALSFSLVESAMTSGPMVEHYREYWMQSVVQGLAAEILGGSLGNGPDCEHFLAGLLVDLGRLAMLKTIPNDYRPVLEAVREQRRLRREVEQELLGIDHVAVGLKLMENWNLPAPILAAVRLHHAPLEEIEAQGEDFRLGRAVAVAATVGDYFCSPATGPALERLRTLSTRFYGWSEPDVQDLLVQVKARADETAGLFSADPEDLGDPADLMAAANEHLAQLALREHVASTQAMAWHEEIQREKQQLEDRNRQLQQQAIRDALTGIYNRHYFDEALRNEVERCSRSASPVAVIFSDVDRFKPLNDTWGHQFGDLVLQRVARAFGEVLRKSDVLGRYGGEEFVVLVHQPTEKGLERLAERLRARIESEDVRRDDQRIPVTISVGAAMALPRRVDPGLAERLVAAADEAMYEAKQGGRNRVCMRLLVDDHERRFLTRVSHTRFSRWLVLRKLVDVEAMSKALQQCQTPHVHIGTLAQQKDFLDAERIERILEDQKQSHERFGTIALRLGLLDENRLAQLLAWQQEDPLQIGMALVRLGLLDSTRVAELLRKYLTECREQRLAAAAASR